MVPKLRMMPHQVISWRATRLCAISGVPVHYLDLQASEPVRQRLQSIQEVLKELSAAKTEQVRWEGWSEWECQLVAQGSTWAHWTNCPLQDLTGFPGAGRGVWISFQLWRAVTRQLELQMAEVIEWEQLLLQSKQELEDAHTAVQGLEGALKTLEEAAQTRVRVLV